MSVASTSSHASHLIDLTPPKDLQSEPFPLQRVHMLDLQKYVYSGVYLPDTPSAYQKEIGFDDATAIELKSTIDAIILIYKSIRGHSYNYKDNIFPKIVELSSSLARYSLRATFCYRAIYSYFADLKRLVQDEAEKEVESPSGAKAIQRLKKIMGLFIDDEVVSIKKICVETQRIIQDLEQFEKDIRSDGEKAESDWSGIASQLETDSIQKLKAKLNEIRQSLHAQEDAYSKTVEEMDDYSKKWTQIPLIGWVPKHILAGKGRDAIKDAMNILSLSKELDEAERSLRVHTRMAIDLELILSDLKEIPESIRLATETIRRIQDALDDICSKLLDLQEHINMDNSSGVAMAVGVDAVASSWTTLAQHADYYRLVAYLRPERYREVYD